jgi:Uri superfamily endonuclease
MLSMNSRILFYNNYLHSYHWHIAFMTKSTEVAHHVCYSENSVAAGRFLLGIIYEQSTRKYYVDYIAMHAAPTGLSKRRNKLNSWIYL